MITENLSTLKIHQLSKDQYKRLVDEGKDDENAFYLTPDDAQIQSDWEETDESADSFIQNKPAIIDGQGTGSIVEGGAIGADGDYAHAEGSETQAGGFSAHAEGNRTWAIGEFSHSEGEYSQAVGDCSHTEGYKTFAFGRGAHAEGYDDFVSINWRLSTTDPQRKVWGYGKLGNAAVGDYVEYENAYLKIISIDTSAKTITLSNSVPGKSVSNVAFHYYGKIGAYGDYSHAEGNKAKAIGSSSHAEGKQSAALGEASHAEGESTYAEGYSAHTEGEYTYAEGYGAHAEGSYTLAIAPFSHAQGENTETYGRGSHTEGSHTLAYGQYSHAEGGSTIANGEYSHVQGTFNIPDTFITEENPKGIYAHIIGNGSSEENRSNAHTIDWSGNAYFSGGLYLGVKSEQYADPSKLTSSQKVLTRGDFANFVIEEAIQKSSTEGDSGWHYRKWNNGAVECWRTINRTIQSGEWTNKGGGINAGFVSVDASGLANDIQLQYPTKFAFIEHPIEYCSLSNNTSWRAINFFGRIPTNPEWASTTNYNNLTHSKLYNLITFSPEDQLDVTLSFYVVGRWK